MATQHLTRSIVAPSRSRSRSRRTLIGRLYDLWRSRQALANLDDARLKDVGISAREAHREATKLVWDVPQNWLR